jgi:metal-sulfur cluster biosynthetic enzyme
MTQADILLALRDCYDPVLPCNLVDLGLVASIHIDPAPDAPGGTIPGVPPRFRVAIALIPTTHDEAANTQLSAQIVNRLAGIEQVFRSEVALLDTPAWTPARITPAGRRTLGLDGNPSLIQITAAHE